MQYTKETYAQHLQEILPESNFTLDIFNGTEHPCEFTCNICHTHHIFSYAGLIARRARRNCKNVCKNCENNAWTQQQKLAYQKAQNILSKKKTIVLIGKIDSWGSRVNTTWKCLKCNHIFERSPSLMFAHNITNCPWCESRPYQYSEEMLKTEAFELWGNEYTVLNCTTITRNKNGSKRILVCHNKCGFKYEVGLYNFLHGQGCPKCRASRGEWKVRNYLQKHNFVFQEQYVINPKDNQYLKLDFYLEQNGKKYAIEYNGIQHYQPIDWFNGEIGFTAQKQRDEIKKQYCFDNNINLIIIPYNDEALIKTEELAQRLNG